MWFRDHMQAKKTFKQLKGKDRNNFTLQQIVVLLEEVVLIFYSLVI